MATPRDDAGAATPDCCGREASRAPLEQRRWRRANGLQLPLHPQQVVGWTALVGFASATFLVLVPALGSALRGPLLPILAVLFLLHVLSHLAALLVDPAEEALRRPDAPRSALPEFDRAKHAHVIENGRCHLCNVRTSGPRTKHCSVCNKCVDGFDHHCKWLNHCVGARNYSAFVVCVVSALAASLLVLAVCVAELVLYHTDPAWLAPWETRGLNATADASFRSLAVFPLRDSVFLAVVGALGVLAAVAAGLLLHLCFFHVYISILGITTYEYIRSYRFQRPREQANGNAPAESPPEVRRSKILYCFSPDPPVGPVQTTLDSGRCCEEGCPAPKKSPRKVKEEERGFSCLVLCHSRCSRTDAEDPKPRGHRWWRVCLRGVEPAANGSVRPNQVRPSGDPLPPPGPPVPTVLAKVEAAEREARKQAPQPRPASSLPALAPPARRRLKNVAELKELSEALAFVQQPTAFPDVAALREAFTVSQRRQQRMRSLQHQQRAKSPRLSPIRESGLSNPSSPQLSEIRAAVSPPAARVDRPPRLRPGLWTTIEPI